MRNNIDTIAIGGFDGMHAAHQKLFERLGQNGALVVIETGYANLTPKKNRELYTSFEVYYFELSDIKHLSGQEFLGVLKEKFPNLKKIVVGYDFGFGANKAHNANDLKRIFDGKVEIVDEFLIDGISVHSKEIRAFLKNGDVITANKLLGKPYCIGGEIIKGQGLGKSEFVPTINIKSTHFLIPQDGIYITKTKVLDAWLESVTFIGHRVSTDGSFAIETHILDGEFVDVGFSTEIMFYKKIRDNKKFDNYDDLKKQILLDIEASKDYFRSQL